MLCCEDVRLLCENRLRQTCIWSKAAACYNCKRCIRSSMFHECCKYWKQQRGRTIYSLRYRMSRTITCRYMFQRPGTHHHGKLASLLAGVQQSMLLPPAKQDFLTMFIAHADMMLTALKSLKTRNGCEPLISCSREVHTHTHHAPEPYVV